MSMYNKQIDSENMKKIYVAPRIKSSLMSEEEMICTSLEVAGKASDSGVTEADSRESQFGGRSIWDDEEE